MIRKRNRNKIIFFFALMLVIVFIYAKNNKNGAIKSFEPIKNLNEIQPISKIKIESNLEEIKKFENKDQKSFNTFKGNYIIELNKERINNLFKLLHEKENNYGTIWEDLNLISFNNLIQNKEENALKNYNYERSNFLKSIGGEIQATDRFLDYLYELSNNYSFTNPRFSIKKNEIIKNESKPVIVTAANSGYYAPLQATVQSVHKHFPDYHLIVYDLGLDEEMRKKTLQYCKCELRKFNPNEIYSKNSPHVNDLKKFSWKPLIIQEALKEFKTVLYIDSSIRFLSNEIEPIVNSCKKIGLLTQYIGLKLLCYTNPKMFDWFGLQTNNFEEFYTIEANILMFHQSFMTSLLMKAWITCALDENCIAPPGSSTGGCCGCHRYDQDALTIISSYFFGHPSDKINYLPAYSFTTQESYFFTIRRYEGANYFV